MNDAVTEMTIDIAPGFGAKLALPPAGRGPGLVLWQEVFGVNDHIRAVARQYALDGFVVLAPDVFWRQERWVALGYEGDDRRRAMALKQAHSDDDARTDAAAAVATLRAHGAVDGGVGTIGWCLGGKLAYLTATVADVAAAACYYPGGIADAVDRDGAARGALQFHFAGRDEHISRADVDCVRAALPQADVHVYDGADHGFNCWARGAYDAPSAALAHGRALTFLAERLFRRG